MNFKIMISGVVILFLYCVLVWLATKVKKSESDVAINIGLLILGGAIGWVIGIFLTPYGEGQKAEFSEYASVIALFVSGYLVGKVDAAISHLFKPEYLFTQVAGFRLVTTFSSFLLGMLVTVVIRYYAS